MKMHSMWFGTLIQSNTLHQMQNLYQPRRPHSTPMMQGLLSQSRADSMSRRLSKQILPNQN